MNFEKYSDESKLLIDIAQEGARRAENQGLMPEHLLLSMVDEEEGTAARLIKSAGGRLDAVREHLKPALDRLPRVTAPDRSQLYVSPETKMVFDKAELLTQQSGDHYVTIDCLLLVLAEASESKTADILSRSGIETGRLREVIKKAKNGSRLDSSTAEQSYDALDRYARDLTKAASEGKLDPVIGRDDEIRRAIQVLSRRTKNNPLLIGDPGVGKTAIVEGLAIRIVNGDVPESLRKRRLMALDLGALLAGAKFRGQFEERLKAVLSEISESSNKIVLFIDEMHTVVGAGASEGAVDASNLLKPQLARGELHCIGATTIDEHRKHIEKDAALARRFQPVLVQEPTVEDTISILRGLKEKYELHHGVRITDGSLVAAASMSSRYITDRFLPDKAIDLVDEAASRLRMEIDSKPEELDELHRRLMQLKIEREALTKEDDSLSKERLQSLEQEISDLENQDSSMTAQWESNKKRLAATQGIKEELEVARNELEIVSRAGDLGRAGQLTYGIIPDLVQRLAVNEESVDDSFAQKAVMEPQIATIVSRWTGIPVDKVLTVERDRLLDMENNLMQRVVGQDEAIVAISNAVRRARAGLQDPSKPLGSFMFLGPTGVGKTELTKALAAFLFDNERAMVRLDMTEYMEKHSVARLIGAPPGYVGYEQGGLLTEAVRHRPYQVVLCDEIEKAHPDVFNVLLQVLDDGRLTDGQGRTINFSNTIVIMTSNLGSEHLLADPNPSAVADPRVKVMQSVQEFFRPEFLNRIDEVMVFNSLSSYHMDQIVEIQLDALRKRLADRRVTLDIDTDARNLLARTGYDPNYGARPLHRVIQRNIQNPLASLILEGSVSDGDIVVVTTNDEKLIINGNPVADAA